MEEIEKRARSVMPNSIAIGIIILLVIGRLYFGLKEENAERETVFNTEFNKLKINIQEPFLTRNEDTGKIIINVPVNLKNESDYSFTFRPIHTYSNDDLLFSLIDVNDSEIDKTIKSNEELSGTIYVRLDTRDIESVKSYRSVFSAYDMYTEEQKEIDVTIPINYK